MNLGRLLKMFSNYFNIDKSLQSFIMQQYQIVVSFQANPSNSFGGWPFYWEANVTRAMPPAKAKMFVAHQKWERRSVLITN